MDEVITKRSDRFYAILKSMDNVEDIINNHPITGRREICGEVYYTTEEICELFNIAPRTLQSYRDKKMISHTSIGGKILYPESGIVSILNSNYTK